MKKSTKIKIWAFLMRVGNRCGCHQREDRSFFIKGWQFPVCSRCFGILTGQLIGILLYVFHVRIPIYIDFIFLLIMFFKCQYYLQFNYFGDETKKIIEPTADCYIAAHNMSKLDKSRIIGAIEKHKLLPGKKVE